MERIDGGVGGGGLCSGDSVQRISSSIRNKHVIFTFSHPPIPIVNLLLQVKTSIYLPLHHKTKHDTRKGD